MGFSRHNADEVRKLRSMLFHLQNIFIESNLSKRDISHALELLDNLSSNIHIRRLRKDIQETLSPIYEKHEKENDFNENTISDLLLILEYLNNRLTISNIKSDSSINSEEYYSKKIKELEQREQELKQILNYNKNETAEQRKIAEETKEKLKSIENELNKKKKELELKEKQEDAKNDWEKKIKETFDNLKEYLNPIEEEHKRLNILYYVYASLCILTLIIIVICEIVLLVKVANSDALPKLNEYLIVLLPIPIAGALMWGFIFQMNRAQRQLIAISNNIHSIKYIQGLLLSINNLSLDINDGISRVNSALDKIISNHLNRKVITSEVDFKNEEGKDKLELEKVLKIISTINK